MVPGNKNKLNAKGDEENDRADDVELMHGITLLALLCQAICANVSVADVGVP